MLGACTETPVLGRPDERIAAIAQAQRGRIARRQLLAAGISSSAISGRVRGGRLHPLHRAVFAVGHPGPVPLGAETAALLAAGDGGVLSHLSAALLHGLIGPHLADAQVHLTLVGRRGPTLVGARIHRAVVLTARDVLIRDGLPVTSPARTALDIAPLLARRQLELALDRGIVDRILKPADVADILARAGGHPGRRRLAAELVHHGPTTLTRSEAEERFLDVIRRADLPPPRVNSRLRGYEVDFYWPDERAAVEIDGFRFHSSRRAFEHDRRKDAALQAVGVVTLRVTWRQITEEPIAVAARVAQRLAWSARRAADEPPA